MSRAIRVAKYEDAYRWDSLIVGLKPNYDFEKWEIKMTEAINVALKTLSPHKIGYYIEWIINLINAVCLKTMECISLIPWYNEKSKEKSKKDTC